MGLLSDRKQAGTPVEAPGVAVVRVVEMKSSLGLAHAPGVVAVLDAFPSPDPRQYVGRTATISTHGRPQRSATIEAVRDHGPTISFFFRDLGIAELTSESRIALDG